MIFLIGVFRHAHLMKKICSSETDEFAENWSYEINTYHVQKGIPNALTLKQKYHSYQKPSKFSFGYWSWPNHKLHLLAITFGFHKTLFSSNEQDGKDSFWHHQEEDWCRNKFLKVEKNTFLISLYAFVSTFAKKFEERQRRSIIDCRTQFLH